MFPYHLKLANKDAVIRKKTVFLEEMLKTEKKLREVEDNFEDQVILTDQLIFEYYVAFGSVGRALDPKPGPNRLFLSKCLRKYNTRNALPLISS